MPFQDFIEDRPLTQSPSSGAAYGFQQESPSTSEMFANNVANDFAAKAGSFVSENITQSVDAFSTAYGLGLPNAQKIPANQINDMAPIGNDGKPTHITDEPMYENVARMLIKDKQNQLVNENMSAKYRNAVDLPAAFLVGVASSFADPASFAAMSYGGAILGAGKVLTGLGAIGVDTTTVAARTAARVVSGSVGGVASMVPLAAAQYGISQYQGGDYDMKSALNDLAFGAGGGAIIHGGIGSALYETGVLSDELMRTHFRSQADGIIRQSATVKQAAINSTIADIVHGRPVDTESIIGKDGQPPNLSQVADDRARQNQNGYSPNMTSEEIAAARKTVLPDGLKVEPKPSRLPDAEINRYKGTVRTALQNAGVENVDDSVVKEIARIKAEQLNPEKAVKPRSSADIQAGKPNQEPVWKSVYITPKAPEPEVKPAPVAEAFPKLPKELAGAKSGYKQAVPQFASDVDKALYVVREKSTGKSKSHDKYVDYLKNTVGLSDGEIRKGSQDVYNAVRQNAEGKIGKVDVPQTFKRTGIELSAEDIAANKKMQERINRSEAAKNKKMGAPDNILQSIAEAGGMRDEGGFLKNRDMRGVMTNRGRLFQKNGMSYGEALEHARDWITDKEYDTNNPETLTHDDLFNALEKEHTGNNDHVSRYEEDLEHHSGEMGIDTTGMKPEEIRAELEARTKEAAHELNALDELRADKPELVHDYYPDMEEPYDEASFKGAHSEHEPEFGAGNERSETEAGDTGGIQGAEQGNASDAGRGAEAESTNGRGTGTTFEPAKNVIGGGEQGVLGGMEQSAKQAMAARGDKISARVEQKPANEGLFQSVIGGGDELDLRIADAEKSIDTSKMTDIDHANLQKAYKEAADADKTFADKMKELGECLNMNGVT